MCGIPTINYFETEKRNELKQIQEEEQTIQAIAANNFVLPVDEDEDDYESKLSRRYSNG